MKKILIKHIQLFSIALILSLSSCFASTDVILPTTTNLNFWEEIHAYPDTAPAASWMKEIANHIVTGSPTGTQISRTNPPLINNSQYKLVKEGCSLLYLAQQSTTTHNNPITNLHSVPLCSRQKTALQNYLNNPTKVKQQQFLNTMHTLRYTDFWELAMQYFDKNSDRGTSYPPFVYWFTELFDIRIATLPSLDLKSYTSTLTVNLFNKLYKENLAFLQLTDSQKTQAKKLFDDWLFSDLSENLETYEKARLDLSLLLQSSQNYNQAPTHIKQWIEHLQHNYQLTEPKAILIQTEISDLIIDLDHAYRKLRQLHSAKRILTAWNARNFELLGSSDQSYYAHEIYGKLLKQSSDPNTQKPSPLYSTNKLSYGMDKWDEAFFKYNFPARYFQFTLPTDTNFQAFEWFNSNDATSMILDFFSYMKENYGDPDTQTFYKAASLFDFQITYNDNQTGTQKAEAINGDMSEILSYIINKINDLKQANNLTVSTRAAVYQALYQMLLTVALTDNKFGQELLSYSYPIFTTTNILDDNNSAETKHNSMGYLLCYVRSILLSIMRTSPEFVDFITFYTPGIDEGGNTIGQGQCRMFLAGASETTMLQDFTTAYAKRASSPNDLYLDYANRENATSSSENLQWIQPFKFNNTLTFLAKELYTISLHNIIQNTTTPPKGLQSNVVKMDDTDSLSLYSAPQKASMLYYPALTKKLFTQMQNRQWNLTNLLAIDEFNTTNAQEFKVIDKMIQAYRALASYSNIKTELKDYLVKNINL